MKNKKQLWLFMITELYVIFITSSVMAIRLFAQSQKEQKAFEELVSFVEETNSQNNTYKPTLSQKTDQLKQTIFPLMLI